jgi:hypothetical protein
VEATVTPIDAARRPPNHGARYAVLAFFILLIVVAAFVTMLSHAERTEELRLPPLIAAPQAVAQPGLFAALDSSSDADALFKSTIPLGADAAGLAPLLGAMHRAESDGGETRYELCLRSDNDKLESTIAVIVLGGDPARVILRMIETRYVP